jgi:hypothetical protein
MDRDKISQLYRVPFIYVSYKVSVHSAKQFQRRRFLEIDQSETIIAYGGHVCLRIIWWEAPIEGSVFICIKFPQGRMKGERHRLSPLSL